MYDSTPDTILHRENIAYVWEIFKLIMDSKIKKHDLSKLESPEKECYDKYIPLLRTAKYGTPKYNQFRKEMQEEGLDHHYACNRHHPEHFPNGIMDMDFFDFIEHVVDCYAASMVSDTSFVDGLHLNKDKYNYPDVVVQMLENMETRLTFLEEKGVIEKKRKDD